MNQPSSSQVFRWSLGYLRPYRWRIGWLLGITVVEIAAGLLLPWPLKFIVDHVLGSDPLPAWWTALSDIQSKLLLLLLGSAAYFVVHLFSEFISVAHTQMQVGIGQRLILDLRTQMLAHLQRLSIRYHLMTGTGDTLYHLENDSTCVESLTLNGLLPVLSSALTLGGMFCILLTVNWQIAVLSLVVVPFLLLINRYYADRIVDRAERVKEMESGLLSLLHEIFSGIRVVQAFARERYEQRRFQDAASSTLSARMRLTWQESFFAALINVVTTAGTAGILFAGGWQVMQGRISIGGMLVALSYLEAVFGPLSVMSHTFGNVQASVASARRTLRTLHTEPEVEDARDAKSAPILRGQIEFRDVHFAYTEERPILNGISFTAAPGQMIALVGLTGAGKTSLVSMIPRFFDPVGGEILLDGQPLQSWTVRSLREQISVVLQDPMLFSGTIADNIRYGSLSATQADIEAAAEAAAVHEFILRLPDGYETRIGEDGVQLSGGERQRISIARALLKQAPILILDEPTSSLDARAEASIFTALRQLDPKPTTLVIAHRLSTVKDADRILVLDEGRIVGAGTHEELFATVALYRELCQRLSLGIIPVSLEPEAALLEPEEAQQYAASVP